MAKKVENGREVARVSINEVGTFFVLKGDRERERERERESSERERKRLCWLLELVCLPTLVRYTVE